MNVSSFWLYIIVPITSAGSKSGVNCTRLNFPSINDAKVFMANVFAKPGTPSNNTCPSLNNPINSDSTKCFCPTITWSIPVIKFVTKALCFSIRSFNSRISIASAISVLFVYKLYSRFSWPKIKLFSTHWQYYIIKKSFPNIYLRNFLWQLTAF